MTVFLVIYLGGFLGTSVHFASNCLDESSRMTTGECIAISAASGVIWPILMGFATYDMLKGIKK